jgi:myo-inositol-1-phosphate synthase
MANSRVGIWLIGAKGGVASTAIVGLLGLQSGRAGSAGLVSELPQFQRLELAPWDRFVIGGHEVRDVSLVDEVRRLHTESRVIDAELLAECEDQLAAIDGEVRLGTLLNVGGAIRHLASSTAQTLRESPRQAVDRLQEDLRRFATDQKLDEVIVVNLASTEPPVEADSLPASWDQLATQLETDDCPLPASSLYAIAALELGYAYLNFTPSLGSTPEAIRELARLRNTCHMGRDGKTGETLLKSTLAPMFAKRNLEVMSWVGHNIFGNLDGKVLDDPINKATKVTSKDRLLAEIFGYQPQTLVSIEYVQSLGDWKTAWDHVHFRGFLGTPMAFQFIWQGCDSLLAAPLVLDLVRFTQRARRGGAVGELTFLSSFFKSPLGITEHDFGRQFEALEAWARDAE